MTPSTPKPPRYKPATFTALDPSTLKYTDISQANDLATQADKNFYAMSDADFAARHPDLYAANKANEANLNQQIQGGPPAGYLGALTRAGLGDAASAFGGAGAAPGSVGEYGVARNIGVSYLDYDRMLRGELAQTNAQTPERAFGLGGQAQLGLQLSNDQLANQVQIGNFQGKNQVALSNSTGGNALAGSTFASAINGSNAQMQALGGLVNTGANLLGKVDYNSLFSNLGSLFGNSSSIGSGAASEILGAADAGSSLG